MTKEQLYREINRIEDSLIEEAADFTLEKREKKTWFRQLSLAACFCLAVMAAAIVLPQMLKLRPPDRHPENPTMAGTDASSATGEETWPIPRWEDKTITERYPGFSFDGKQYSVKSEALDAGDTGEKAGEVILYGYDIYEDREYTIKAELYDIEGILGECALAVRYEGTDDYYPGVNSEYVPETLGDLINALSLKENLVFHKIYYSYWMDEEVKDGNYRTDVYVLPEPQVIWDMLLSETQSANQGDAHYDIPLMEIGIDVKKIGAYNISLAVNEDGYLQTNIMDTAKSFYIGKDKADEFVQYVRQYGTMEPLENTLENEIGILE